VNNANIIKADVVADNGVSHIIDTVLLVNEKPRILSYVVKDYMIPDITTIPFDATVREGAKIMAADKNAEGYAIVLKEGTPIGIITERDIVHRVVAKDLDSSHVTVAAIMSSPLISIDPDEDLLKASTQMEQHKVRKLVVMRGEILYGIITGDDIAQHCGDYVDRSIRDIMQWTAPLGV